MADKEIDVTLLNATLREVDGGASTMVLTFTGTDAARVATTYEVTLSNLLLDKLLELATQVHNLGTLPAAQRELARDESTCELQDGA